MICVGVVMAVDLLAPPRLKHIGRIGIHQFTPIKWVSLKVRNRIAVLWFANIAVLQPPALYHAGIKINSNIDRGGAFVAHHRSATQMGFDIGVMRRHQIN